MEIALVTVEKIVELFIILLVGVLAVKIHILDSATNKHLTDFLLNIVQPCVLFMSYQIDFDRESLIGLGITAILGILSFIVMIILATILLPNRGRADTAIERTAAVFSNCGFIGIPIVSAVAGREGVFYLTAYISVYHLFLWTYAYNSIGGHNDLKTTLKNLIRPCTVAIMLGLICFILRIRLPGILAESADAIGGLNAALAMIIAGGTLADCNIAEALRKLRPYYISFIKLILFPVITILILKFIPVSEVIRTTVVMAVACPTGSFATMLAVRFDADSSYASLLFSLTTLLSLFTIPLIVVIMTLVM